MLAAGFSIEALAMSSGVGSASMMTGSSSALVAHSPEMTETINGYAAASQPLPASSERIRWYFRGAAAAGSCTN